MRRPSLRTLALTLALLCGLSVPATAMGRVGLRADLNADGITDTLIVRDGPTAVARVELRLSGDAAPVFLLAPTGVRAFRLLDLTGDGRTDLLADSASGPLVWAGTGAAFMPHPVRGLLGRGSHVPRLHRAPSADAPTGDNDDPPPAFDVPVVPAFASPPADDIVFARAAALRAAVTPLESRGPPLA